MKSPPREVTDMNAERLVLRVSRQVSKRRMPERSQHFLPLANRKRWIGRLSTIQHAPEEFAEASIYASALQCRAAIDALDLLDVEADVANAFLDKEVQHFVDSVEALCPDHADYVKRYVVAAQGIDTPDDAGMCPFARPSSPPGIMKPGGPVQTYAHANRMLLKKFAPCIVHQHAVGLHRMRQAAAGAPREADANASRYHSTGKTKGSPECHTMVKSGAASALSNTNRTADSTMSNGIRWRSLRAGR